MHHNTAHGQLRLDRVMLEWTAKREELEEIYRISTGHNHSKTKGLSPSEKAVLAVMAGFQTDGPYKPLSLPPRPALPSRPNIGGPGLTILESNNPLQKPRSLLTNQSTAPPTMPEEISRSDQQTAAAPTHDEVQPGTETALTLMAPEELAIQKQRMRANCTPAIERRKEEEKMEEAEKHERFRLKMTRLGMTIFSEKQKNQAPAPSKIEKEKKENQIPAPAALDAQKKVNPSAAPPLPAEITIQKQTAVLPTTLDETADLKQSIQEERTAKRKLRKVMKEAPRDEEEESIKARIISRGFAPLPVRSDQQKIISSKKKSVPKENGAHSTSTLPVSAAPSTTASEVTGLRQVPQEKRSAKRKARKEDEVMGVEEAKLKKKIRLTMKDLAGWPLPDQNSSPPALKLPVRPKAEGLEMGIPDDNNSAPPPSIPIIARKQPNTELQTSVCQDLGPKFQVYPSPSLHGPPISQVPTRDPRLLNRPPGWKSPYQTPADPEHETSYGAALAENLMPPYPVACERLVDRCPTCSADLSLRDRTYNLNLTYCPFCQTKRPRQVDVLSSERSAIKEWEPAVRVPVTAMLAMANLAEDRERSKSPVSERGGNGEGEEDSVVEVEGRSFIEELYWLHGF